MDNGQIVMWAEDATLRFKDQGGLKMGFAQNFCRASRQIGGG